MKVTGKKFQSSYALVRKQSAWKNQRTTLPQSRPFGRASSLREGAGVGLHHSSGCSLKSGVGGRFSSPLRNSKDFGFYHSTNDTPSVTPFGRASSLREGAGRGAYHSSGCSLKSGVTGDFHRPYETQKFLHFTVQRAVQKYLHFTIEPPASKKD